MKTRSVIVETTFLQSVVVLIGLAALAFLLVEPLREGRNANATVGEVYFRDPFLAFAYVASLSFFVALYQAFRVLRFARRHEFFSQDALRALRTIKYCAIAMIGFVVVGEVFILLPNADEPPQAIFMGLLVTFAASVVGAVASLCAQVLQEGMEATEELGKRLTA